MNKPNSALTMKDVALEAGVALGTVSKVINGIPVGESYRVRVEEAIAKLNYRINSYAKGLKQKMGQRVPEDVQVIGFDGIRHFGDREYTCSTIVQPLEEMAEVCVNMVLEKDEANPPSLVCLPVRYAYGGTTKA